MTSTNLVLLGDYSDDQAGYNSAVIDGAVHIVSIDEQSYSSMYNVQQAIQATCSCTGVDVSIGLVKNGKYISLHFAEDTSRNSEIDYQDLNEAFELAIDNQLEHLRAAVDVTLEALSNALPETEERRIVDHCVDCIDQERANRPD